VNRPADTRVMKKRHNIPPSEITDRAVYLNRRRFIAGMTAASLSGAASAFSLFGLFDDKEETASGLYRRRPLDAVTRSPFSIDERPTDESDALSYTNFYEFGARKGDALRYGGEFKPEPWRVTVDGECGRPGDYTLEDILRPHPLEERVYRLRCVETWSMVIPWVGLPLADLLERFEPASRAKYVAFETLYDPKQMPGQRRAVVEWPYREGLRIDEAMHPLTLIAVGMYGETLPVQNGAPLRLVVPWKYGFKSIKSIVRIHFSERQPTTTWNRLQPDEYGFYANVNPSVDHPRWSQARERPIGGWRRRDTLPFNGYAEEVAHLYRGMDLAKYF